MPRYLLKRNQERYLTRAEREAAERAELRDDIIFWLLMLAMLAVLLSFTAFFMPY